MRRHVQTTLQLVLDSGSGTFCPCWALNAYFRKSLSYNFPMLKMEQRPTLHLSIAVLATSAFVQMYSISEVHLDPASSPLTSVVEIQEMAMQSDVMTMRQVRPIEIGAGQANHIQAVASWVTNPCA